MTSADYGSKKFVSFSNFFGIQILITVFEYSMKNTSEWVQTSLVFVSGSSNGLFEKKTVNSYFCALKFYAVCEELLMFTKVSGWQVADIAPYHFHHRCLPMLYSFTTILVYTWASFSQKHWSWYNHCTITRHVGAHLNVFIMLIPNVIIKFEISKQILCSDSDLSLGFEICKDGVKTLIWLIGNIASCHLLCYG